MGHYFNFKTANLTMNIIFVFLVFQFLIFIHELGHFLAAKKFGVAVEEFSLGIPPRIISKKIKETLYVLSLLPIGGYVKIKGFIQNENSTEPDNYSSKTIWQRSVIIFSGPLFNLILSFLLLTIVFLIGIERPITNEISPLVGKLDATSIAAQSGLQKGDIILRIANKKVTTWQELELQIFQNIGKKAVILTVEREDRIFDLTFPAPKINISYGLAPFLNPIVGQVVAGSVAEKVGIKKGDLIISINDESVTEWSDISATLNKSNNDEAKDFSILLKRNAHTQEVLFQPSWNESTQKWVLGVGLPTIKKNYSLLGSLQKSIKTIGSNITATFSFIGKLILGRTSSEALGGPIMIATVISRSIQSSFIDLLYITAFISLQLAIFNLLPIPALDGGHLLLLLFEKIKGKAPSVKFRKNFQTVGFMLLLGLIIFVTTQDIFRLFN